MLYFCIFLRFRRYVLLLHDFILNGLRRRRGDSDIASHSCHLGIGHCRCSVSQVAYTRMLNQDIPESGNVCLRGRRRCEWRHGPAGRDVGIVHIGRGELCYGYAIFFLLGIALLRCCT